MTDLVKMCKILEDDPHSVVDIVTKQEQDTLRDDLRFPFVKMAAKYDYQYMIADEFMCSDTCPCWSPPQTILGDDNSILGDDYSTIRVDPQGKLEAISEEVLNGFGRTKKSSAPDSSLNPLVFESRELKKDNSVQTFE